MNEQDSALDNLQQLICHQTQPNQTKPNQTNSLTGLLTNSKL